MTVALSVFRRAMELISSEDAEVDSRDAACWEDPWARLWLEVETWEAALATSFDPSFNSRMLVRRSVSIRWITITTTTLMPSMGSNNIPRIHLALEVCSVASFSIFAAEIPAESEACCEYPVLADRKSTRLNSSHLG